MPTNKQHTPPKRVWMMYHREGSPAEELFQLSVISYISWGKKSITAPINNAKILPKIIIQSHSFAKFKLFVPSIKFVIARAIRPVAISW